MTKEAKVKFDALVQPEKGYPNSVSDIAKRLKELKVQLEFHESESDEDEIQVLEEEIEKEDMALTLARNNYKLMDGEKTFRCVGCGDCYRGFGNNPEPAGNNLNDRCCDECNMFVMIARFKQFGM